MIKIKEVIRALIKAQKVDFVYLKEMKLQPMSRAFCGVWDRALVYGGVLLI